MTKRVTTNARVQLTLEIDVSSNWGPDCTIDQVHKQATEAAMGFLNRLFDKRPMSEAESAERRSRAHIVGAPKIQAIIVEETPL